MQTETETSDMTANDRMFWTMGFPQPVMHWRLLAYSLRESRHGR
jgi:hypothetical protein